jgi:hypothetical protein
MTFTFRTAIREGVNLLIGIAGGTGSGKTYSAMRMASGIAGDRRFAVIDTENGRARHYADRFSFDVCDLGAPFRPDSYAEAIIAADKAGYPVIVVDSMSHVWAGDGGVLDWQEEELDRMAGDDWKKRESVKMAAWIKPKMSHKHMLQKLLQVKAHLILCFRAEPKIEMVKENGKMVIQAKQSLTGLDGWLPVCEKNLPFELTVSFLMTADKPGYPKPIKLQEQHKAMFPLDKPIDERSGEGVAAWAKGGDVVRPDVLILANAILGAGFEIADVLKAWKKASLADVTDVQAALAWIDKAKAKLAEKSAPVTATQAGKPSGTVTLGWLTKRFNDATDIDLMKADAALIDELPEADRETAREEYSYHFDRLTKGAP